MDGLGWTRADSHFTLSLIWTILGFGLYYFLSRHGSLTDRVWKISPGLDPGVRQVVMQRVIGFLLLGIVPILLILLVMGRAPSEFGSGFKLGAYPPWWSSLLIPLILVSAYIYSPSRMNLERYPQFRINQWTPGLLVLSGVTWIVFITGYEFLFRGLLLHASLDVMSTWGAIALNCILYSAAHLYKGYEETIGALPVGILFCYLTIVTGNIWSVVILHSIMALSNEWFSIWRNPDLVVIR